MRIRWTTALLLLALAVLAAGCGDRDRSPANVYGASAGKPAASDSLQWSDPPPMKIDINKQYVAVLETSLGKLRVELLTKTAPSGVNNFVFLAKQGFYEGVPFHRIIKGFMVQTGDPTGTGGGGPGYTFPGEKPVGPYDKGIVAYANRNHPDTQGSQFFICSGCGGLNPNPIYTQFGRVVEGMDVLAKLESVETVVGADGNRSKPVTPPVLERVTIEER